MAAELALRDRSLTRLASRLARVRDEVAERHGSSDPLTRLIDEALRCEDPRVLRMAQAAYEAQRMEDEAEAAPPTGNWVFLTAPDGSRVRKPFSFGVFTDLPFDKLGDLLRLTGLDALRRSLGRHFGGAELPAAGESGPLADPEAPRAPADRSVARAVSELDDLIERRGRPEQGSVLAAIEARLREAEADAKGGRSV